MSVEGSQRRRYRGFLILGGLLLIGLAGSLAWLARPPALAARPVPNPNGYDTLLAAGRLVAGDLPAQKTADRATEEELRAFVAANPEALARAETGCSQESVVPIARMPSIEVHLEGLGPFRQLGRLLTCQAVLARREGRTSEALRANLDLLRLAHAVARGGLLTDQLLATAIQRPALQELEEPLLPQLSAADARRAIAALEQLGQDHEPVQQIADRDLDFALSRQGVQMRVAYAVNRTMLDGLRAPAIKAVAAAEAQSQGRIRLLLARLALHAYSLDHPERPRPDDLKALVPSYLAEVPLAPGNARRLTLDDLPPEPNKVPERP